MNNTPTDTKKRTKEAILCQECKNEFMHEREEALKPGDKIQCPVCGTTLAVTQKEMREGKEVWLTKPVPEEK